MFDFLKRSRRQAPQERPQAPVAHRPAPQVWRQGDVFLIATPNLPEESRVEHRPVLAEGEVTGHAHRLADPAAGRVFTSNGDMYLEVLADSATVVHEEHGPVTVPRGGYVVRIQR